MSGIDASDARRADHRDDVKQDNLEALQEAIDEWKAGDEGMPLNEAFNAIRAKCRIAGDA